MRLPVLTFSLFFKPADLWIGLYIDRANRTAYICPVPMFGVKVRWRMEQV